MKRYPKSILALVLVTVLAACSKTKKENITDKMVGMRKWRGHSSGSNTPPPSVGPSSSYSRDLPDTVFALVVAGPTTIALGSTTFEFEKLDTPNRTYYFGRAWEYKQYFSGTGIIYFEANDSILYVDGFSSHNGSSDLVYHTYK